jgi:hypothetical protein
VTPLIVTPSIYALGRGLDGYLDSARKRGKFCRYQMGALRRCLEFPADVRAPNFEHIDRNFLPFLAPFAGEPDVTDFFALLQRVRAAQPTL